MSKFGGVPIENNEPSGSVFGGVSVEQQPAPQNTQQPSTIENIESMIPNWVSEGAAAMNRPVLEFLDFLGPDTANAILSLSGSETRVPTLMDNVPGAQGNFMEDGLAKDIIRGAGETATIAATGGAGIRNLASKAPEFGATVGQNVLKQVAATTPTADIALGAASGAGAAIGEDIAGDTGKFIGGIVAPLAPSAALLTTKKAGEKLLIEAAPAVEMLKTQARQLYKSIDNQGAVVSPNSFSGLVKSLNTTTRKEGLDRTIHPKATAALKRFNDDLGNAPTTSEIDTLRRVAKAAAASTEPDEARIGKIMVDKIDDYMDNLKPNDFFLEGDTGQIGAQYREARGLWSKAKKSELLQEAITKAKDQASGFENGLRVQFRQILNNKKKLRGFGKEEIAAMRKVVQGTSAANLAKLLGKLGFSESQATQLVGTSIGIGGGAMVGGPIGAVAVPIFGQVSKTLAQKLTANNAQLADAIVRSGKNADKIAQLYIKAVPKKDRSAQELARILKSRGADLNLLEKSKDKLINDTVFIVNALNQAENTEQGQ